MSHEAHHSIPLDQLQVGRTYCLTFEACCVGGWLNARLVHLDSEGPVWENAELRGSYNIAEEI